MNLMTKSELKNEVGKKWFLADDNTLAAKLIYISGIEGFDNYLGNADQKDKNDVIHLKEMPNGVIISLAKNFSANEVGINYSKISRVILTKLERYSVLKFETTTSSISFGLDNRDLNEIIDFFKTVKSVKYDVSSKSEIPDEIRNKLENYLFKNTDLLPLNTEEMKATKTKRFLNYFIDITIISFISVLFGLNISEGGYNFTPIIVFLSYYLIFEGAFRTTIGKIITNTKVVGVDGTRVDEIFIRTICRIIPFEPLSFLIGKMVGTIVYQKQR